MKFNKLGTYFLYAIILLPIVISPFVFLRNPSVSAEDIFTQFQSSLGLNLGKADMNTEKFKGLVEKGRIKKVYYNRTDTVLDAEEVTGRRITFENPRDMQFMVYLLQHKVEIEKSASLLSVAVTLIMFTLIILIIIKVSAINEKKKAYTASTKAKLPEEFNQSPSSNVRFSDVAGNEEAKENMMDIIQFLKDPEKFKKFGVKIPKGIILYGPPGTGKTLLAKALAGETGASFISTSGANFVEKYVGVGASRIRALFNGAREKAPAIIFIDEIDAVGGKRGIEGTSEDFKTLNQLLVEMDGFKSDENIIVVAATNRLDILDDALLRAGRFDRHVMVDLPDLNARYEILKVHGKNKPLSKEVDLFQVAKQTVYMSGADLAGVMNEAAIYAIKENCNEINLKHIDKGINKIIAGDEKKDRSNITQLEKKITAYHEAGHALIAKMLNNESVPKVSIIPTTKGAAGYTIINPEERMFQTKEELLNKISGLLGGRAAEEIIFGKDSVTGGASNDLQRATRMALTLITKYGMSDKLGLVSFDDREITLQNEIILNETKEILDSIYKDTLNYILVNRKKLELVAKELLNSEVIQEKELEILLSKCV